MNTSTRIEPAQLPAVIGGFLAAHAARDMQAALRAFAPTAVVVDEGRTFRGTEEVRGFLRNAGTEFSYTTELIGAERIDDLDWVAINRLEGDFPGGVAELTYRFSLADDLISELVIAPATQPTEAPKPTVVLVHGAFATRPAGTA
ncbi:nuclear transport factor 2 family protein [Occultella aeris]|uniref:SnoaL-like domain protein n=1 Tax=Occultella aeris TaxID=2761496 RepID=A0A7M4DQZ2_9MICO|nr:nuclear transport factor 2 family protein [Occultella aeris]VZO39886.1 SnoaL-like domain protein [Occultella aeris]